MGGLKLNDNILPGIWNLSRANSFD